MSDMTRQTQIFDKILKKDENKLCADCRRKSPSWASLNLGVLICMKCSGIHRGLGVHISKVKSVNLDKWPEDALTNFQKINNKIANAYWESKLKDLNYEKLQNDDYKLNDLIRDKYERKKYCDFKKTDPMTLIMQGKIPEVNRDDFKDVTENDPNTSDEDRSTKRKTQKPKGFKIESEANKSKESSYSTNKQEPLYQINTNNTNLISFDNNSDNYNMNNTNQCLTQNQLNISLFNNLNNNTTYNHNNNCNSSNNNTAKSKFGFIGKNKNNLGNKNYNNNNINTALFHSTPNMQNTSSFNNKTKNINIDNNLFNFNNKSNSDLMDFKSGDSKEEEKLKKITDNIDELYNRGNNNNNFNSLNGNGGFSIQNKSKNQNDLFNALNPQFNSNPKHFENNPHTNTSNGQNNFYNLNQIQQMIPPNHFNMSRVNNFYPNANMGYGNCFPNQAGCNENYQFNNPNNQNNFQQMSPIYCYMNNTINNGLLTANDIYFKKNDLGFNLNVGSNSNGGNFSNENHLQFDEIKLRKNEDPFSNLISFK